MDKSRVIFGNEVSEKDYKKACKSKAKYAKKFGYNGNEVYHLGEADTPAIGSVWGVRNLVHSEEELNSLPDNAIIIGNIRMGFGHYRISMAMASCARSMGYVPYWLDLHSFQDTTCGKVIAYQNQLYSMGSRLSQKFSLFNKFFWEPMNSEGFRHLSYNAADQKNAELMASVMQDLPKDIPYVATHVWPAQAAVHAGMTHVVNAVPDNWPMALHLAEGAIHTVQTPSSYLGYRTLRGMDTKRSLRPMPSDALYNTGHYVDHELVSHIEADCDARLTRMEKGEAKRYLITVGGAGAQKEYFEKLIRSLLPDIQDGKAVLFINTGDHKGVWDALEASIPEMKPFLTCHLNNFEEIVGLVDADLTNGNTLSGIHAFCDQDIFSAVYSTNLLMRISDILITKPSELSFYPIPKLLIHRVGGHEAWGAIRSAEVGDGTYECSSVTEASAMLHLLQNDDSILMEMCENILNAKKLGIYDGAYKVIELAVDGTLKS